MSVLPRDERATTAEHKAAPPGASDEELLREFVADRSDLAFAQLVTSHGPLVMAVCRRILGREEDAEDAFQATFLVLARKAASLRRAGSLAAWLHKTAYRVALRAKAVNVRRREKPLENETMIAAGTLSEFASDHDQSVFDEELNRLPDKYRLPLFLCCVEGLSREEAAGRLGWSLGSLKGRLERGRRLLLRRLLLRRVSLGVALALFIGAQQTAQAAVAPSLVAATVQAGVQYAAGQSVVGYVSQDALSLANGSLHAMSLTTSKIVLCSLTVVGLLTWGTSWLPAPAIAGGDALEAQLLFLQTGAVASPQPEALVAFVAAEDGDQPRRSPEAEGAVRPSAEADAGPRRSAEGEGTGASREFQPQTRGEAALYAMILQLRHEVIQLREELLAVAHERRRSAAGDSDAPRDATSRDAEQPPSRDQAYSNLERAFQAYDKDRNGQISFDEFLATREGAGDPRVRGQAEESFKQADQNSDGSVSFEEFLAAGQRRRERDQPREGDRPGSEPDRPRDGEGAPRGPRDGEGGGRDRP